MVIKKMSNANKVWRRDDDEPQRKKRRVMIGDTGKDGERTLIISGAAAKKPSSTPPPPCASAVADNNISHLDGMKKGSYVIVWGDDNKLYKAKVQKIIHDAFDTRIRVQYEGRKTTALLSRDMIYSVCDTSRRQLRGHDPIALAIKRVAYNAAKQSSSSSSPKNSISTNIGPYPLKPVYQVGTHVYAAYWPPHDIDREREPSWYPGIISSSHFNGTEKKSIGESSSDDGSGSGERARLYNINFDDGDSITNVPEQYVFLTEEYLVCAQEGRRKKDGLPWLGDVINIVDDNSSDDWARYVGWYMVTIDGVQRSFALLIDALRAYDSSVLRSKGWAKTKLSDLNLPEEWTEMLSKKLGKEEEGDKEVQEKTGKEVGTQTSELTTTKKDRSSARSCLPVDWYNALSARPRGESIEYYHFSSTVNNNQLKLAKSHSMNESDDDDDDFSVDMVDGIEIRSKSNSHEERNKSISDWKCFKCKVGNCQKWTNVKGGFCESHVGSAKTSNTKTICGKDKFDGAGTDESSGGERNSDSGMEFDCYDVGMNGAEMSTTFEESQPKNLLPTIQGIQSSREEPQSTPTLVAPIAEIMNEEQSTVVVAPLIHNSAIEHKHTCTGAAATTKNSPTVKKWKSKSMPPQIATTSMHEKQPTAKPIRVILMNSKLTTSSCHTAEMSDGGIEESDDGKVIDLTILEEQPAADVIDLTISEEQPAADPAASPPHHPPPSKSGKPTRNSEGYLMVWTCDVCRVAQLPTFEEAVEHEKICTGLPPSSPLPLQLPNICEEQSTAGVPNVGFINDEQSTALALPIVGVESTHQIQVLPKKKRPVETSIMDYTYTDYSQLEKKIDVVGVSTKSSSYFPAKLHAILSDSNNQHILCWQPHGRSWKIVDKDLLSSIILPKYFEHVSENSFKTMLGQWGFKPLLSPGPDYKSYYHEWFLRGCPDLTKQIQRLINPGIRLPNLADEPNLYEISQKDAVAMSMVDNQAPEDTEVEMDTGGTANDCSQGHNNIQNPATEVAPPPPKDGDMARPIVLPALQPIPKRAISPVQGAPLAAAIVAPLDNLAAPGIPAIVAAENVVDQLCKNCPKLLLQRKQYKKVRSKLCDMYYLLMTDIPHEHLLPLHYLLPFVTSGIPSLA